MRNGSNLFQGCDKSPRLELQQFYSPELQLRHVPYRRMFIFFVNFKAKPVQVWILLLVGRQFKAFFTCLKVDLLGNRRRNLMEGLGCAVEREEDSKGIPCQR